MLSTWYQAIAPHLVQSPFISSGIEIFWKVNLNYTIELQKKLNEITLNNVYRIRINEKKLKIL